MKKIFAAIICLLPLYACKPPGFFDPETTGEFGLIQNDLFMRAAEPDYVPNDKTIALIMSVSDSLLAAPFYKFNNFETSAKTHGLGYDKHYEYGGSVMATVFAYHARIPGAEMPTDIHSDAFAKIYKNETETLKSTEGELYKNIKVLKDEFVTATGINKSMEFRKFEYSAHDTRIKTDVISIMYLTIHNGAILKVRINYPAKEKNGPEFEARFMQELAANLTDFNGNPKNLDDYRNKLITGAA